MSWWAAIGLATGQALQPHPAIDLIVSDDEACSTWLARNVQVLLFDERGVKRRERLLPAGALRDLPTATRR